MRKTKKLINSAVVFAAFFVSAFGKMALAQTSDTNAPAGWHPETLDATNLPSGTVSGIISNFMFWTLGIFGVIAIIGFAISGIMYLVAAGDEDTMKKAKQAMIYSIIGVVVALSGLVALYAISNFLNASSF
jgi:hypothetical protein